MPERPEGCFAQMSDVPFFARVYSKRQHKPRVRGQLGQFCRRALRRITPHFAAALAADDPADLSEQQPQIVGHFGRRADGGAGGTAAASAGHRDGRRQTVDPFGLGFFQAVEKLPRIGREAFDVPPLSFGVERVDGQARLAAAAESAEDDELAAGDIEID